MKAMLITEMPMSCEECVCSEYWDYLIGCQVKNKPGSFRERPEWCPLVPVKDIKDEGVVIDES